MSEERSDGPNLTLRTVAGKQARADRLAEEMRRNLIKRKRQQRDKAGLDQLGDAAAGKPSKHSMDPEA